MQWIKYIGILVILIWSKQELTATNSVSRASEIELVENEEVELRKNGEWFLFVEDAYAESITTGKPILANFTGSDWCGWCIRLKNEVFKTDKFLTWAAENVVLLELDFPRKKTMSEELRVQNSSLAQAFQVTGYPTIWVFNLSYSDTENQFKIEALGKTGYVAGGPDNWILSTNAILKKPVITKQATTKSVEPEKEVEEVLPSNKPSEDQVEEKETLSKKERKKQEKLDKKAAKAKAKAEKKLLSEKENAKKGKIQE
jgi:protein disulfide-isomerase